jgi:pimeloyl-ACP methyl ester carboxylesterase
MQENARKIFIDASGRYTLAAEPSTDTQLGSLHAPTVVLDGDDDEPTMGFISRRVARNFPCARLVLVPGADDLIILSRPEVLDAARRELLP